MERIGDIIKRVIEQQGQIVTRRTEDIDTIWYRVVDGQIGEHSYVLNMKGNKLTIRVDSRCYLAEIKRREAEIISKLHNLGYSNIKNIRCRIG